MAAGPDHSDKAEPRSPPPPADAESPEDSPGETYAVDAEPAARPQAIAPYDPPLAYPDEPPAREQFSLRFMFVMMLLGAALLAPLRNLGLAAAAAAAGALALVGMVLLGLFRPRWAGAHYLWWLVVVLYLAICVAALFVR